MLASVLVPVPVFAQSLGTFRWQLEPYCNVLTLAVTHTNGIYTLDGFDDQCGAATRAPVTGSAIPNPDGTIGLGINIVTSPSAEMGHVVVVLNLATLGGSWRDSNGFSGAFSFNPAETTGQPRPLRLAFAQFPRGLFAGRATFMPDGGISVGGAFGESMHPLAGDGSQMVWHPGKAAFRAGLAAGGQWSDANTGSFSAAFGHDTIASSLGSFAAGNRARATGPGAVALGEDSVASGGNSLAMGFRSSSSGTASAAIGSDVSSSGLTSIALGFRASTVGSGAFVFGDRSTTTAVNAAANQFVARASGGVTFYTNAMMTSGASLAGGSGSWSVLSDVHAKQHFRDLDGADILAKIAGMPIREWSYRTQDASIRHAGPTAQDFHAAFGLGEDVRRISTVDADGIALRAIQALELRTRDAHDAVVLENERLKAELAALRARLERLEANKK